MKPLTGREASILALLAQSRSLRKKEIDRILLSLTGDALKIGSAITGRNKNHPKAIKEAAKGFLDWANDLPVATEPKKPKGNGNKNK